jgi:hypothetical protein
MNNHVVLEGNIAAVFRELSPENQAILLACARLLQTIEYAAKKPDREQDKTRPESRFSKKEKVGSVHPAPV